MGRPVGAPVDRDGDLGAQPPDGLGRAHGIEVLSAAQRGTPAPDRDEGKIQVGHEIIHAGEQVRVSCEVDPARADERIAERDRFSPGRPATVVLRKRRLDRDVSKPQLIADLDLDDVELPETGTEARWRDDPR